MGRQPLTTRSTLLSAIRSFVHVLLAFANIWLWTSCDLFVVEGNTQMTKILGIATVLLAIILLVAPAGAQETQLGSLISIPNNVPTAGEYTITADGLGFIPDTEIVLAACTATEDLVLGITTDDEITEILTATGAAFTEVCDLANLTPAAVDSEGHFNQEVTVTIGDNFVLIAGALDQSQGGAVWIPVLDSSAAAQLAVTGAHSWSVAIAALAAILAGFGLLVASRRHEMAISRRSHRVPCNGGLVNGRSPM